MTQPAFHRDRIQRYASTIAGETYAMLDRWRSGKLAELREEMMRLTFSIVPSR